MYCPKPKPIIILLGNTFIVLIVFLLIDFLYYGLLKPRPAPYTTDFVHQIIYTFFFAMAFAHVYNKASRIWRPNSNEAFFYDGRLVPDTDLCKASFSKILNGIIFSLLVSAVIILAMMLSTFIMAQVYIFILHGIRGDLSQIPGGAEGTGVLITQVLASSVALESKGRTEDDPDR